MQQKDWQETWKVLEGSVTHVVAKLGSYSLQLHQYLTARSQVCQSVRVHWCWLENCSFTSIASSKHFGAVSCVLLLLLFSLRVVVPKLLALCYLLQPHALICCRTSFALHLSCQVLLYLLYMYLALTHALPCNAECQQSLQPNLIMLCRLSLLSPSRALNNYMLPQTGNKDGLSLQIRWQLSDLTEPVPQLQTYYVDLAIAEYGVHVSFIVMNSSEARVPSTCTVCSVLPGHVHGQACYWRAV